MEGNQDTSFSRPAKDIPGKKNQRLQLADALASKSHFNRDECIPLIAIHEMLSSFGRFDRLHFRDFIHNIFDITDSLMLDLTFRYFDQNNDGVIDVEEFIMGISAMSRGDASELIEASYSIYDMNGDRSLVKDELSHCLKGCIIPGYGIDHDDIEEAERDIVDMCMKKLDVDQDGLVTYEDFYNAVHLDPLLIQACGACLPSAKSLAAFFASFTDNYRGYTAMYRSDIDTIRRKGSFKSREFNPAPKASALEKKSRMLKLTEF